MLHLIEKALAVNATNTTELMM